MIVTRSTAKDLISLGFNKGTSLFYKHMEHYLPFEEKPEPTYIGAPSVNQALNWVSNKLGVLVRIEVRDGKEFVPIFNDVVSHVVYSNFESAQRNVLKSLIEQLKKR